MEQELQEAIVHIKNGDLERGRKMLIRVLELNSENEVAWLWMTKCLTDPKQKRKCFNRVLEINPDNKYAQDGLKRLDTLSELRTSQPTSPSQPVTLKQPPTKKKSKIWISLILLVFIICASATILLVFISKITPDVEDSMGSVTQPGENIPQPTKTPQPTKSLTGKWIIELDQSEFDDSQTVVLGVEADKPIEGWLTFSRPTLIIRCKEGDIETYVNLGLSPDVERDYNKATVRVRFDNTEAIELKTSLSTDGDSVFFQEPKEMIYMMLNFDKMIFGFTPFNAPPVTTSFDLHGLSDVIEPLMTSCNWDGSISIENDYYEPPSKITTQITPIPTATFIPQDNIFVVNQWQIQIDKVEILDEIIFYGEITKPSGRFAALHLLVTNVGQRKDTFIGTFGLLDIIDADNHRYEEDITLSFPAQIMYNYSGYEGANINPEETRNIIVVYDISEQSEYYYLTPGMLSEDFSGKVLLDLP